MEYTHEPVSLRKGTGATRTTRTVIGQSDIEESYREYLRDESRLEGGVAEILYFPESEEQIAPVVSECYKNRIPLTCSAGRTGIAGGAVPRGGVLLSMESMNRLIKPLKGPDSDWPLLWCEPGVTLMTLEESLNSGNLEYADSDTPPAFKMSSDFFYPPDPTEKTAHLGGTIATNASGGRSFRYGSTRRHIRSIRVFLSNGACYEINRGSCQLSPGDTVRFESDSGTSLNWTYHPVHRVFSKNTAGYYLQAPMDLIDLFIGSEGTLGILTAALIQCRPKPESDFGLIALFPGLKETLTFIQEIRPRAKELSLSALEFFDYHALSRAADTGIIPPGFHSANPETCGLFIDIQSTGEALEPILDVLLDALVRNGGDDSKCWAADDVHEREKQTAFRHAVPESINSEIGRFQNQIPGLHKISTDFAVCDEQLIPVMNRYMSLLKNADIPYAVFGHIGDNHVHINLIPHSLKQLEMARKLYLQLADSVLMMKGTISAEHGIGKLKGGLLKKMWSSRDLNFMLDTKNSFDPFGLLGRGNIFE